ncbi:hypothetical protein [Streptomyces youssoufiensis]
MTDRIQPTPPQDTRRLVAAGIIRPFAGRRITLRATPAGITGTASRVATVATEPAAPDKVFATWTDQQLTARLDTLHAQIIQLTGDEMWQAIHWRDRVNAELTTRARAAHRRAQARLASLEERAYAPCPHHAGTGAEA